MGFEDDVRRNQERRAQQAAEAERRKAPRPLPEWHAELLAALDKSGFPKVGLHKIESSGRRPGLGAMGLVRVQRYRAFASGWAVGGTSDESEGYYQWSMFLGPGVLVHRLLFQRNNSRFSGGGFRAGPGETIKDVGLPSGGGWVPLFPDHIGRDDPYESRDLAVDLISRLREGSTFRRSGDPQRPYLLT